MSKKSYNFVLNILCVAKFVTSSVAVFEAAIWVKSTDIDIIDIYLCQWVKSIYMTKSRLKTRKKGENVEIKEIFT